MRLFRPIECSIATPMRASMFSYEIPSVGLGDATGRSLELSTKGPMDLALMPP